MRRVLRGDVGRGEYVALLVDLAALYDALETELDRHAGHPVLAPFAPGALRRHAALLADVAALAAGPPPAPGPAARAYAAHLHALGASAPVRLVAHAYVRYMGDLSGGQILRGIVERALALRDGAGTDAGTAFHDFAAAGDPDALKRRFRDALDALPAEWADAVVDEALVAFAMHERLFTERDGERDG